MASEIFRAPGSPEELKFQYSTLWLHDEAGLRTALDEPRNYLNLLSDAEPDFETPTKSMTLYAERAATPESLQLHATSEFTPADIIDLDNALSWQDALRGELLELYPDAAQQSLAHDSDSLYTRIGHGFYGRISTSALVDRCILEVDLVSREQFDKYAGTLIDDEDETAHSDDPALVLKEFAVLWQHAHNIVIQNSAYSPLPVELSIVPPPSKEIVADKVPAEAFMPVSELVDEDHRGFNYIGGLTTAKSRLQEIAEAFNDGEARSIYGIGPTHFMLYGPPGTGKTTLVEALADELNAKLVPVSSKDVIEKWVGSSARNLATIFKNAKKGGYPTIVFFDEFEALGGKSEKLSSSERHDVLKVFNTEIIEISRTHPNIIIAAATNVDTHEIEPSLIRSGRLEPIQAGLPNEAERIDIWSSILARLVLANQNEFVAADAEAVGEHRFHLYADDINPLELARLSDSMTGADFEAVIDFARRRCYRHYKTTGNHRQVGQQDLVDGINAIRHR